MLDLASFWLSRCLRTHEDCPQHSSNHSTFLPTRLLDVGQVNLQSVRLIQTAEESIHSSERRYVTLSHCWGKTQIITTTNTTLQDRLETISLADLSNTFRDAVTVARRLGFRYLWIDSLCIIQDNRDDWLKEAAQMSRVYSNATFTISAAHARAGDVGCFKQRDGLRHFPVILCFPHVKGDARMVFQTYGRPEEMYDPDPPLYGRAWVYQEQILSPRSLIFDGSQLRWQCLSMHGSDHTPLGGITRDLGHLSRTRKDIVADREFFSFPGFNDEEDASRFKHLDWYYTVMDYTYRGMTKPSDRLIAIAGIASAIQEKTDNKYVAGIWRNNLWAGLLWSIPHQLEEYAPTTAGAYDIESNAQVRHSQTVAPSWSWASVTTPVVYLVPTISSVFLKKMCYIEDCKVQGSVDSQKGTLKIRGHVRTAYINSVYQYIMPDRSKAPPSMVFRTPRGQEDRFTYSGRSFFPSHFFLFSAEEPSRTTTWHILRGTWRPDEIIDPRQPITFLAIAQVSQGSRPTYHIEGDPLEVYTIGLVPTNTSANEYRRVGYGVWKDCSWYGYKCGAKLHPNNDVREEAGLRARFRRGIEILGGRNSALSEPPADGHNHRIGADLLPAKSSYNESLHVSTETLKII